MIMKLILIVICWVLYCDTFVLSVLQDRSDFRLLVLIVDAMRWDLFHHGPINRSPIGVEKLVVNGAYVERIKPVFPAECHPNIFSLFSGKASCCFVF